MKKKLSFYLVLFAFATSAQGQQTSATPPAKPYSIVIKGGHVIDPKNHINEVMDIAIQASPVSASSGEGEFNQASLNGKIAVVAKNIDTSLAVQVVNAKGLYVTPGLIDIHVHVFWGTDMNGTYRNGPNGVAPDGFTFRTGVTTVVDAGSSGWKNFEAFKKQTIDFSKTRVLAMLNIIGEGMAGGKYENDSTNLSAEKAAEMAKKYPHIIVGFKNAHYYQPNYLLPIDRAIKAGTIANVPIMLDGKLDEAVMSRFRKGDIFTHIFGRPLLDSNNKVYPFVREAQQRGVIFDVGFGGASFDFARAIPALKDGFFPNSISSDLHINSMNNAMKDMNNIMSLFMAMGMDFDSVIAAATWNPAREIKREDLGSLTVGSVADIAILRVREGDFGYWARDGKINGNKRLETEMTIRGGTIVYNLNGLLDPINLPAPPRRARVNNQQQHGPSLAPRK